MSTLGKSADRAAERERRWKRSLAETEIRLKDVVAFAVAVLSDYGLADDVVRALALNALLLRDWP
jgi:hypothetical protein